MPRKYSAKTFPVIARGSTSFSELFTSYLQLYPAVSRDIKGREGGTYAESLLRIAGELAKAHPGIDLWGGTVRRLDISQEDHQGLSPMEETRRDNCLLEEALRYTMRKYEVGKGTFEYLFARNLKERLRRETARAHRRQKEVAVLEQEAEAAREEQRTTPDATTQAAYRWASRILGRAAYLLDSQTRTYIEMSLEDAADEDIAIKLGIDTKTLNNRFRGERVKARAQTAIRQFVLGMPEHHRSLLWRHLQEEVGLTPESAAKVLACHVTPADSVPVMEEEALLAELGWLEEEKLQDV